MPFLKLLLISSVLSLLTGQLIRLPLFSSEAAINLTDLLVIITVLTFLVRSLFLTSKIRIPHYFLKPYLLFSIAAVASTVLALNIFNVQQIIYSSFFLVRFLAYSSLVIVIYTLVKRNEIAKWSTILVIIGYVFIIFGFVQLFFFNDLTFLTIYGWDPHQGRIVSTLLDPNFAGIIFIFVFSQVVAKFLFLAKNQKGHLFYFLLMFIALLAIILTFSRSTYLAFLTAILVFGLFKSPKATLWFFSFFAIAALFILPMRQRIIGVFTLDETAIARIESYQKAFQIIKNNPLFGIGFNTYRAAQASEGFFTLDNPEGGHAGSGTDSSFLLILATTGIVGFIFFGYFLFKITQVLIMGARNNFQILTALACLAALIIHSQFVNSFFYPQVMFFFWFNLGLALLYDSGNH